MNEKDVVLEARGVEKSYRDDATVVPVLRGVNLAVRRGETVAILGTSGSDYHQTGDEGRGGIQTETPIKNNDDLLNILKSGAFTRIETE